MNLGFIPKGNYSFKELLELVVKQKFSEETAKPITVENGIEYNSSVWSKDWESAREIIRQALEAGTLTAWFRNYKGEEDRIPKDDWIIPEGDSFADSYFTLSCGTLQHGDRRLIGTVVYVPIKEADVFLNTVKGGKKSQAHPDTIPAKMAHLHQVYVLKAANILGSNPHLTGPSLIEYSSLKTLIRDSGLDKADYPKNTHILKHWMKEARKLAGLQNKFGPKSKK